ncbi:MAG: spore germination protein [Clostridiaceae bacterium]|nr:spore germination protein [Clostridiaceae bacterium]
MKNVLNGLKKYLVYHEPKNTHTFELLETEYEGTDKDGFEESMNDNNDNNDDDDGQGSEKNKDKENGKENAKDSGIDNDKGNSKSNNEDKKNNNETIGNKQDKNRTNGGNKDEDQTDVTKKSRDRKDNAKNALKDDNDNKGNHDGKDCQYINNNINNININNSNSNKNNEINKNNKVDKNGRNNENSNQKQKKENSKNLKTKTPLKIEEWNEAKKKDDKNANSGGNKDTKDNKGNEDEKNSTKNNDGNKPEEVSEQLDINLKKIQEEFVTCKNSDLVIRQFMVGKKYKAFIVFIDGMVDRETINNYILRQLMMPGLFEGTDKEQNLIEYIEENVLAVHDTKKEKSFEMIIRQILNGLTVLFVDGGDKALIFETRGYEKRSVEKPVTENVILGSQEGFNENLRTNITLIRRIVKNSHLVTEIVPIGKENNSHCGILYIEGIANPKVVNEVKRRIASLDVDFIHGEGMLEQLIEDKPFLIFPQVLRTERPDRAASFLMNGKVLIVADGTPFVIAVPISFFHMIQTSEDANMKWQFATVLRQIRAIGLLISVTLPGIYIALTLFHQEMIPTDLLIAVAQSRENVPFPVVIETILMELSFELIREAGVRVPGIIGTTLGIIGALILGQAAVAAGIVSPILIIVVAVTGLGNFTAPDFALGFSIRILRFALIILGGLAGFYGISIGLFIIVGSLCNAKSFGVPLLSPIGPKTKGNAGAFFRSPYGNEERSDYLNTLKRKRTSSGNPRKWTEE